MEDLDLPHINQTGHQKGNSCADAIFATLEVISQFVSDGDKVYMCLYDLHKAYDSVEYSILLKRLYEAGINSKCWRLIKAWYHQPMCKVKVDGKNIIFLCHRERCTSKFSSLSCLISNCHESPTAEDAAT